MMEHDSDYYSKWHVKYSLVQLQVQSEAASKGLHLETTLGQMNRLDGGREERDIKTPGYWLPVISI